MLDDLFRKPISCCFEGLLGLVVVVFSLGAGLLGHLAGVFDDVYGRLSFFVVGLRAIEGSIYVT